MQPAHRAVERRWRDVAGVREHVDDARVRARRKDEHALVSHAHGDESFVHDERIRVPGTPVGRAPHVSRQSDFVRGHPRDFTAHRKDIVGDPPRLARDDHLRASLRELRGFG